METSLIDKNLTELEKNKIGKLLKREDKNISNDLEQMWYLMDLIWESIGKFYSQLIWLLKGLFIEQHDILMGHRHTISDCMGKHYFKNIVEYSGSFATLARLVAQKDQTIQMNIYEPSPSEFGLRRAFELEDDEIFYLQKKNYESVELNNSQEIYYNQLKVTIVDILGEKNEL